MLSFYDHSLSPSGKTPVGFAARLTEVVARLIRGSAGACGQGEMGGRGESLPSFRGRNALREDIGLPPLDQDGLPL
jgi:hypothetical protein